ncbi:MAG TPA: hypothetical protein VG294_05040 [Solirubrobacteraceae bacterium]|nr:hypothetical protein [Solirubrobacteraceae bacterium]
MGRRRASCSVEITRSSATSASAANTRSDELVARTHGANGMVQSICPYCATTVLDMSDFPTGHSYSLGIWQNRIERIMAA